jgi:hypothetical protein
MDTRSGYEGLNVHSLRCNRRKQNKNTNRKAVEWGLMERYSIAGKIIFSSIKILTFSKVSKPAIF